MILQVVLIAVGVFLGLAGEEWREDRENARAAADTMHRFRAEVAANRDMILGIKDYHAARLGELNTYLAAPPETRSSVRVDFEGIQAPRFQTTAWELAVASGTIAFLDQELASALAGTYAYQTMTDQLGAAMMQVMYESPPRVNGERFLPTAQLYYDDLVGLEQGLLDSYETLIAALDESLAR
jgi:hypothetical protein